MEDNLHEIDILIQEYPYYSLLYFKRAKLLAQNKNEDYKNALKIASVYAPNRRKLQEFIENPTDYRKQIVTHPEWLTEDAQPQTEKYTLNVKDEEIIKEVLILEENQTPAPVIQETPIVKEVQEIEEILSHFTEETSAQNSTIQEIEHLKQIIQENQEKARRALFQQNEKKETISANTVDITAQPVTEDAISSPQEYTPEITEITQETNTENINLSTQIEITEKNSQETITETTLNTEIQQPVRLNVPKIKEWFEEELKAVRSEKEEKENQIVKPSSQEQSQTITEQENNPAAESTENQQEQVSAEGYLSWLDELLAMEKTTKTTTKTQPALDKKALQNSIIDKFLQNQPKMTKPTFTETTVIEDKTETQSVEYEDIASETLAKIFVTQKQYDRAIRIYKVLIGKNPSQKQHYEAIIQDIQAKMNGVS